MVTTNIIKWSKLILNTMQVKGRKIYFFFYTLKFLIRTPVRKERLSKEKHTNVFNINFMWCRSLHKERKTKRQLNFSAFMLSLIESGELWKDMSQRICSKCWKLGKIYLARLYHSDSSLWPFIFGDKVAPFLWV